MPRKYYLYLSWLIAIAGTVSSLVMSEMLDLIPCTLCWYQRILLYPLVIVLAIGIYKRDHNIHWYALPFAILGIFVALYHWLIQLKIIPHFAACTTSIPCGDIQLQFFNIITIPAMSAIAFTAIAISLILYAIERPQ